MLWSSNGLQATYNENSKLDYHLEVNIISKALTAKLPGTEAQKLIFYSIQNTILISVQPLL